jgi:hypothetical protein
MIENYSQPIKQCGEFKQEAKLHLLPLLTPSRDTLHSSSPPLHLLPKGQLPQERIAFHTRSKHGMTNWVESSHVFPSAYPRFEEAGGKAPLVTSRKDAENLAIELASRNLPQLWSVVQRIVPVRPCTEGGASILPEGRGLTIVVTQIEKFEKKEWEQALRKTVLEIESKGIQHIEEIWILAGDLQKGDRTYEDSIRDVQQFIHFYLPVPSSKDEMKRFGPYWPADVLGKQRENSGRKERTLIGLGHICPAKMELFDGMVAADIPNEQQEGMAISEKIERLVKRSHYKLSILDTRL